MRQMTGLGNLSILAKLDTGIWRLVSDLFYVPKAVFPIYVAFVACIADADVTRDPRARARRGHWNGVIEVWRTHQRKWKVNDDRTRKGNNPRAV